MKTLRIEVLAERDRPALVQMLSTAGDFDGPIEMYRNRPALPDTVLVAWRGQQLVGMSNANYKASLGDKPDFEPFNLSRGPHAFLDRTYVSPAARRQGIGRALIDASIRLAREGGCTFAGGFIDAGSDPTVRLQFFQDVGFHLFECRGNTAAGVFL